MSIKKKGVIDKLEFRDFAEWKFSINEMQKAELKADLTSLEFRLMQKEAELLQMKMQLMAKNKLEPIKNDADVKKVEYEKKKSELESKLGYSLNDKAIDEVTLEVKDLSNIK